MTASTATDRSATGVAGLDLVIRGGLIRHRIHLFQGNPGSGKTTLALQYLMEGARQGEPVLYFTLSETKDELLAVAASHGWSLHGIELCELSGVEARQATEGQTIFNPAEVELGQTTRTILAELDRVRPKRVVFDSLSELRLLSQSALRYRRQLLALKDYFIKNRSTVVFIDDLGSASDEDVQSLVHGVIELRNDTPTYGSARRRLQVVKLRGSDYLSGWHDFRIQHGGMRVFPRLGVPERVEPTKLELASTGVAEFDRMLGGGLHRGTSLLAMGAAGVGKSTLCIRAAMAAVERGEQAVAYIFDETLSTFTERNEALGLSVRHAMHDGRLVVTQIDPAEVTAGEFTHRIQTDLDRCDARLVVIDSLNGYIAAMPGETFLILHLHELLVYLNQRRVTTLMTLAQHGMLGPTETPLDVSYVADTVAYLRYFEAGGVVRQALSVIKKRTGSHERSIREFQVVPGGFRLGQPLQRFAGILAGTPTYLGDLREMLHDGAG